MVSRCVQHAAKRLVVSLLLAFPPLPRFHPLPVFFAPAALDEFNLADALDPNNDITDKDKGRRPGGGSFRFRVKVKKLTNEAHPSPPFPH